MNKSHSKGVKKKPMDKTMCIVCGSAGLPDSFVSLLNSTVASTNTPLLRLLTSVIGEEPCFSMGCNICHQCFMFFNRLDTYQARANELFVHLKSRYIETKHQYMGSKQKLSDQIYSSLSNIKKVKNGTSLNVCNELTVTVYHSGYPPGKSGTENTSANRVKATRKPVSNGILSQKRKLPCTSHNPITKKHKSKNTTRNDNSNSESCSKVVNITNGIKKSNVQLYCKVSPNSFQIDPASTDKLSQIKENNKNYDNSLTQNDTESESGAHSLSDSSSSDSDSESTKYNKTANDQSSSSSNTTRISSSSSSSSSSSAVSSSNDESSSDENKKSSSDNESAKIIENKDNSKKSQVVNSHSIINDTSELSNDESVETGESDHLDSHLAEVVLMQNHMASSLLHKFMSTSLWMGSSDETTTTIDKRDSASSDHPDDITVEALQSAVEAQHCKEKRLELKNTGQSYINTKGKLIDAKHISPQDCSRCSLKCNNRLDDSERKCIFADYWGLGDYNLQREYLANHMNREEKVGPSGCSRTVVLYFLSHEGTKVQVCRQFFLKTLDVSEKASRIVLAKKRKACLSA